MAVVPDTAFIALCPDWVCEVLSPSTEAYDRGPKMVTYARFGVRWAWLLDPEARVLEVFRNDDGAWRPERRWSGHEKARAAPFEAIEIELGMLWG